MTASAKGLRHSNPQNLPSIFDIKGIANAPEGMSAEDILEKGREELGFCKESICPINLRHNNPKQLQSVNEQDQAQNNANNLQYSAAKELGQDELPDDVHNQGHD